MNSSKDYTSMTLRAPPEIAHPGGFPCVTFVPCLLGSSPHSVGLFMLRSRGNSAAACFLTIPGAEHGFSAQNNT